MRAWISEQNSRRGWREFGDARDSRDEIGVATATTRAEEMSDMEDVSSIVSLLDTIRSYASAHNRTSTTISYEDGACALGLTMEVHAR